MIFVTVGTASFDPVIEEIDRLIEVGRIKEPVVGQIGRGNYIPHNFRYFRFMKSLKQAYDKADIIVSTGGAGTTIECVKRGLRLVVVENRTLMEGHQAQLISEMEHRGHLIWCRSIELLASSIDEARSKQFFPFETDNPRIHKMIQQLIGDMPID